MDLDVRERLTAFVKALPVAHRVMIVAAVLAVAMLAVPFVRWITTPSYTVLYSGLDDQGVAEAIDGLETAGVPYQLEGSRVLVPQEQLYATRAALAQEGIAGRSTPAGYELLDAQGLSVSDFRQRVDYQRALEGEIAKTLIAMDGIRDATVHLVVPEKELFAERQEPVTASVLLTTNRTLGETEVEAVTFLVTSSVEGLDSEQITVADSSGTVLHAPGDAGGSVATNRNMRQTREFEQALAADVTALLERVTDGTPASVVVRANLNFDEEHIESETYDPEAQVVLREQTNEENFEGTGMVPGGTVGVDGGPLQIGGGESIYDRAEDLREFGVNKTVARTTPAPGRVEGLSVAVVMDDGSLTGVNVPADDEIEALVGAALALDAERGDEVAVTAIPMPVPEEDEEEVTADALVDHLPQIVGALLLLLVALALFLMSRRRRRQVTVTAVERTANNDDLALDEGAAETQVIATPKPTELPEPPTMALQHDVAALIERQPEEIATLLRGWLADRRGGQS